MSVSPTSWSPTLKSGTSTIQTFTVSASNGNVLGVTISKIDGPNWLTISPTNLGDISSGSSKSFTLLASPPSGTSSGSHQFKIRVICSSGSPSSIDITGTITVTSTTTLGQVQLSSPMNGSTLPPGNITFSWKSVSNATKYEFVLYNHFGQVALDTTISNTYVTVALGAEETITWKVRAGDNSGNWGPWSSTWSLTLKSTTITLTLYILENSLNGQPLSGVSVGITDGGGNTFSQITNSSGYISVTGVPGTWYFTAMKSGYDTKSWSDTITTTCTKYQYITKSATPVGTIDIFANFNGQAWSGSISYKLTGPETYNGSSVPQILSNKPVGTYTITYISGGPPNSILQSITPSATQTLSNGGIIAFTFNFISQQTSTKPSPPLNLKADVIFDSSTRKAGVRISWEPPQIMEDHK